MFTILWYSILIFRLRVLDFLSFSSLFSLFIFLIISGRIPFPLKETFIETWMIFGLIFLFLSLFIVDRGYDYVRSLVSGKSDSTIFTLIFLFLSFIFSSFSFFKLSVYQDGYYFLFLIIISVSYILTLFGKSNKRENIRNKIFSSIVSSTLIISLIAYLAQLLITLGIYNCDMLRIYHPDNDIHCIPFLGTVIYRFSIGSNINEFSMYLLLSLIIVTNRPQVLYGLLPFKKIKFFQNNSLNLIKIFLLLAITLCLSRAAFIGVSIFYAVKSTQYILNSIYFSEIKINKKDLNLIFIISFIALFLILGFSDFAKNILELLRSRFGFILNFSLLLEGASSESRLNALGALKDEISNFSILPLISLGKGTVLHNSFLQFMLELGFLPAISGLLLLLKQAIKKTSYVLPLFVFLVSHHILYNPILWIYLASVSMLDKEERTTSFNTAISNT